MTRTFPAMTVSLEGEPWPTSAHSRTVMSEGKTVDTQAARRDNCLEEPRVAPADCPYYDVLTGHIQALVNFF